LEELVERTQRTFIKLSFGILGGILLLILLTWGGCHAYQGWEEGHQVRRAVAFLRDGNFKSAALSARRALQLNSNSTGAMRIMAQLAEKSRDRAALDWRRKIVELEPNSRPDALALANCALQFGDIRTAEKSLTRIDDSGKQTAAFHAAAARLASARKNSAEAKNEFGKALRLAPNDESYQMEYALACLEQPVATEREEGLRSREKVPAAPAQRRAAAAVPPPVAGAAAADVVAYFNNHRVGLQVESLCDGLAALLLLIFAASITARLGGTASLTAFVAVAVLAACVLQFVARVAWTVACSVTMLVRPASNPGRPASQRT